MRPEVTLMTLTTAFVFQDVQHNCQLHRISFCADDKTDKRIFTFICKDSESNKHLCYVFDSEKCVSVLFPCPFFETHLTGVEILQMFHILMVCF